MGLDDRGVVGVCGARSRAKFGAVGRRVVGVRRQLDGVAQVVNPGAEGYRGQVFTDSPGRGSTYLAGITAAGNRSGACRGSGTTLYTWAQEERCNEQPTRHLARGHHRPQEAV
jgi:hypothetical protein